MIRFCDKMAYCINEGDMSRGEMFSFFLRNKECETDVIAVYDNGKFLGIVTYDTLLYGVEGDKSLYINTVHICVGEQFWEEANAYFKEYPKELVTVVNEAGEVLGFAYYEDELIPSMITGLPHAEKYGLPILSLPEYQRIKMLVITDLNELAWRCRKIFEREGLKVCVIGEKWEWFGYKSGEGYLDYADFEKIYLYAEGTKFRRIEERNKVSRFGKVKASFGELGALFQACSAHVYTNEIERLIKLGVSVCEIDMPAENNSIYKTKDEMEFILYEKPTIYEQWINGKECLLSDKEKLLLEKVMGSGVIDALKTGGVDKLGLTLAHKYKIGELSAKTLKEETAKKIYIIGPCIVVGRGCLYQDTLVSCIQKLVDKEGYAVIGIAVAEESYEAWKKVCRNISLCETDILLVINRDIFWKENKYGSKRLDMSYIYNNRERGTLFSDTPIHSNAEGNRILAQEVYENYLKEAIEYSKQRKRRLLQKGEILSEDEIAQTASYVKSIKHETEGTVGAIVMNCNPFTYGHQYLIAYAAERVDWLYIFVVEENRSYFTFEDRLEMVKKGTGHLANVIVVPSGRFVLSYETMPIYFEKTEKQDMKVDARLDLEIFARHIAPALNISKRFVGEEPIDKITKQYNCQMQEIFELFELELEIIPRNELEGEVISASRVRKCMKERKWEQVKELVPETTFEKCMSFYSESI